jgi:hypothetical protein
MVASLSKNKSKSKRRLVLGVAAFLVMALTIIAFVFWPANDRLRMGIVQQDLQTSKDGKQYRRVVRLDRDDKDKTVTTTVTFTDTVSGGVGEASYTQPILPSGNALRWQRFFSLNASRLGLSLSPPTFPPGDFPLLSVPEPIEAGRNWHVRLVVTPNGDHTIGSGREPKGAGLSIRPSELSRQSSKDTFYGQGVQW